ncbi:unnamed protein product [Prunus brigantina]
MTAFFVVETTTHFNALLGRDWIHGSMCVPSSLHQFLQFWHDDGSVEIVQANVRPFMASANVVEAKFYEDDIGPLYFTGSDKNGRPTGVSAQKLIDLWAHDAQADGEHPTIADFFSLNEAAEHGSTANLVEFLHEGPEDDALELEEVELAPSEMDDSKAEVQDPLLEINLGTEDNHRPIYIDGLMEPELRAKMEELLREFKDCFAWDYTEMPGLSRDFVEHRLPTVEDFKPFKQPPRRMSAEVELQVKEEIVRLVKAKFIRPARYVEWLSNIVPVKKKTGAIRICVDFRNLNLATPKDEYPMPMADLLVDGAAKHEILSFMDGHSGYNQIFIAEEDVHKTAFKCPGSIGTFEYVVMPFGLKNVGATYQRAMNAIFHDMISRNIEVYIDDVVIKSESRLGHLDDLRSAFERMRRHQLKMNPKKCAFGVSAGNFLGFLVHQRGIEIDKNKAKAIIDAPPPKNKKGVQSLLGQINFLRRFIDNSAGKVEPFSSLLKLKDEEKFR